jgi:catechol 2,3-dioxygenase
MRRDEADGTNAGDDGAWGTSPPGYRLPAATRVGAVRLQVADLERSLTWYTQILGFAVADAAGGTAQLTSAGGATLIELHELAGAARVPRNGRLGLYHFAILLPDRAALGRFVSHLQRIGVPAGAADHLVSEALYLHDPDGLGIEVYADRPREEWLYDDERQLRMDTVPLDTGALVRAARDEPWTGMPDGTTIGHIHLHVGDLDAADGFYHRRLGLDRTVWSYPGALFLSAGGYHHHLGLNTWAAGAPPAAPHEARLLEWELVLPSDADVARALGHAGAPADDPVLHDPWGTALRLVSR